MWVIQDNQGGGWYDFASYESKGVAVSWLLYYAEEYPDVKWRVVFM